MFCPECGSQINSGLRYCNNCGARVRKDEETKSKDTPLGLLIAALAFIVLGGLGILVGLLGLLLNWGVKHEVVGIVAIFYLASLTAICFSLIRMMSKLIGLKTKSAESSNEVYQPVQFPAVNTAQLEEPKQQPFSVVENTTRTFDEVFVKKS